MLYGLGARDVVRLRQLLTAYEQGRIRINAPDGRPHHVHQVDLQLGSIASEIPPGGLGTAYVVRLDLSNPPNVTIDTDLPTFPVYNPNTISSLSLDSGIYLFAREPSEGYYVPCSAGGATGTDAIGNMFLNGLCISVGGTINISLIDGGSDW